MSHFAVHHIPIEHLHSLWRELVDLPFPSGVAGTVIDTVALDQLDHDTCAIVERFLNARGRLSESDTRGLVHCRRQLEVVIPLLDESTRFYFTQLDRLTQHVLDEIAEHMLHLA